MPAAAQPSGRISTTDFRRDVRDTTHDTGACAFSVVSSSLPTSVSTAPDSCDRFLNASLTYVSILQLFGAPQRNSGSSSLEGRRTSATHTAHAIDRPTDQPTGLGHAFVQRCSSLLFESIDFGALNVYARSAWF
ncbi:unnamed protein product [Soboliphyme baturini]|uniref:Secreted protein n=1 Tax=Soboliphyme baturini TaxID=241478 RepID=A0A183J197_9BILA|nr:unnamed protein product [Soboliphyme baturini]